MAGIWNQGGGSDPCPTREELIDVLKRVEENLQAVIAEARACPFCDSSVHEDGDISHDEDCSAPYIDQALGRTTNEPE